MGTQGQASKIKLQRLPSGSDPEPESESSQGSRKPSHISVDLRIQRLQNRRFHLMEVQQFRKRTPDGTSSDDCDGLCELEAIEKELKELKELQLKKKQGKSSQVTAQQDVGLSSGAPRGGIYMLPLPQGSQDSQDSQDTQDRPLAPVDAVVPVDRLGPAPAFARCPSCREVVFTETRSKVGQTVWLVCCTAFMMGCIAGCCIMPFFMKRLMDVHHHCPSCQERIHVYQPI
ncbi:uncharacterized protein V6R79_024462 [Siganus canaliculatus]